MDSGAADAAYLQSVGFDEVVGRLRDICLQTRPSAEHLAAVGSAVSLMLAAPGLADVPAAEEKRCTGYCWPPCDVCGESDGEELEGVEPERKDRRADPEQPAGNTVVVYLGDTVDRSGITEERLKEHFARYDQSAQLQMGSAGALGARCEIVYSSDEAASLAAKDAWQRIGRRWVNVELG
eukprot:TRINITY_DN29970_c0_g1_i1.p1 TRINITY_DN29970_c0_g1~~TRINITY_DN29970_c0_g1_i1.p1  ORF type:complete len:195 (+),score=74.33 TRINITY_DN29970_c0_g1_i1:46-585(+)